MEAWAALMSSLRGRCGPVIALVGRGCALVSGMSRSAGTVMAVNM